MRWWDYSGLLWVWDPRSTQSPTVVVHSHSQSFGHKHAGESCPEFTLTCCSGPRSDVFIVNVKNQTTEANAAVVVVIIYSVVISRPNSVDCSFLPRRDAVVVVYYRLGQGQTRSPSEEQNHIPVKWCRPCICNVFVSAAAPRPPRNDCFSCCALIMRTVKVCGLSVCVCVC